MADAARARGRRSRGVTVVLPWRDAPRPFAAFRAVADAARPFFRRASAGPRDLPRWSYLACDPTRVLTVSGSRRGPSRDPFEALARAWPAPLPVPRGGHPRGLPPFAGGWAGSIGYECRSAVERIPAPRAPADGFPALVL